MVGEWVAATVLAKWCVYTFSLIAGGGAWFVLCQQTLPVSVRRSLARLTVVTATLAVIATLVRLAVQAGYLIDDGWIGAFDPQMLALAAQGPLGTSSAVRIVGLVLVTALIVPRRGTAWLAAFGAALVAASFALTGHVAEAPNGVLPWLLGAHVAAASFWLGALWPLHRLCGVKGALAGAAVAAERFGRQAAVVMFALLSAGAVLAWTLVGSFQALVTTGYGRGLIVKLVFVGVLLVLALVNKWRLVPALGSTDSSTAIQAGRALRRSIRFEALLFAVVLFATAVLTSATTLPVTR